MRKIVYRSPSPEDWQKALEHESLLDKCVNNLLSNLDKRQFTHDSLKSYGWEGLLQAVQNFDPKRGRFSTLAWCCIRNAVLAGIKEELAQQTVGPKARLFDASVLMSFDEISEDDLGLDDESAEVDESEDLYRSIAELPDMERTIVLLRYFGTGGHPDGYSTAKIASILGYSRGHVQAVLASALEKLKHILEQEQEAAA